MKLNGIYLTTRSDCGRLSVVLFYLCMRRNPYSLGCRTLYFPPFSLAGACVLSGRGGSSLVYQVLPAIGAVSILELAANSGRSRMSQASNLHLATQLVLCLQPRMGVKLVFKGDMIIPVLGLGARFLLCVLGGSFNRLCFL